MIAGKYENAEVFYHDIFISTKTTINIKITTGRAYNNEGKRRSLNFFCFICTPFG
jgi:hypothetical protein